MSELAPMHLITTDEYRTYLVSLDNAGSDAPKKSRKKSEGLLSPPMDYKYETTTIWSFPDRGNWATHSGTYRGNWSPYIPRNLILKYTKEGDTVLDQMCGSGTTLVECKLLRRNAIGIDVNPKSALLSLKNLDFNGSFEGRTQQIYIGDARNLNKIEDESIDLIATHPPYAGIIPYSRRTIDADLSALSIEKYVVEMLRVAEESFRVLKPGKYCAILIGDTRKHLHYIPISIRVLQDFLETGFILKEDIIKLQWKMQGTRERWRGKSYDFYKIGHEHLYVFRKSSPDDKLSKFKLSRKWW